MADELDKVVEDPPDVDIAKPRVASVDIAIDKHPTAPLHNLVMSLDLENPEAVASFLEAVAASIRERKRIVLIIE